jgi:hypothetical protein
VHNQAHLLDMHCNVDFPTKACSHTASGIPRLIEGRVRKVEQYMVVYWNSQLQLWPDLLCVNGTLCGWC